MVSQRGWDIDREDKACRAFSPQYFQECFHLSITEESYSPSVFINQSVMLYPFIFWYGLRNIHCLHCLTTRESVELRIDLQDEQGNKVTWGYQQFRVDGPDQKYHLHTGQGMEQQGHLMPWLGLIHQITCTLAHLIMTMTRMVETAQ